MNIPDNRGSRRESALTFPGAQKANGLTSAATRFKERAFTLIEGIGVLAIVTMLVSMVAPSVIRRVDRAVWTKETADLQTLADAYTQSILRTKTIPGTN